jgi:hypothetical protein
LRKVANLLKAATIISNFFVGNNLAKNVVMHSYLLVIHIGGGELYQILASPSRESGSNLRNMYCFLRSSLPNKVDNSRILSK